MGRRLISLMVSLAIGTVGALVFASPSTAAPVAQASSATSTRDWCEFPEENQDLPKVAKAESQSEVSGILPQVLDCIEVEIVDKCDGTTVVTLTNWAKVDATWTRLKVEILGVDYVVKGGPDHEPVVITLGPPGVEDVQAYLVFEGSHDGTSWRIEKAVGDPYSWEEPKGCVSPSPSATASPSPSVTATTSAPATTTSPAAPVGRSDSGGLPVTGAGVTSLIVSGIVLLVAAGFAVVLRRRRNSETVA